MNVINDTLCLKQALPSQSCWASRSFASLSWTFLQTTKHFPLNSTCLIDWRHEPSTPPSLVPEKLVSTPHTQTEARQHLLPNSCTAPLLWWITNQALFLSFFLSLASCSSKINVLSPTHYLHLRRVRSPKSSAPIHLLLSVNTHNLFHHKQKHTKASLPGL